jgi:hypothetical protein
MSRIRIDDLPVVENLTPEQEEMILGAGLRTFRPRLESLESRDLLDAGASGAVITGLWSPLGQEAQVRSWAQDVSAVQIQTNTMYQTMPRQFQVLLASAVQPNQVAPVDARQFLEGVATQPNILPQTLTLQGQMFVGQDMPRTENSDQIGDAKDAEAKVQAAAAEAIQTLHPPTGYNVYLSDWETIQFDGGVRVKFSLYVQSQINGTQYKGHDFVVDIQNRGEPRLRITKTQGDGERISKQDIAAFEDKLNGALNSPQQSDPQHAAVDAVFASLGQGQGNEGMGQN